MRWLLAPVAASVVAVVVLITTTGAVVGQPPAQGGYTPSKHALADIPPAYLRIYQATGVALGVDWAILAGIGKVETDHGRSSAPGVRSGLNAFGCCAGPMQANVTNGPPSTWDAYGHGSPYRPEDAVPFAARLLLANGAPGDYRRALMAYNAAGWYVAAVLAQAQSYRGAAIAAGGYVNPFADPAWLPARTDQGVDWIPIRPLPVLAIGDCVVTYSSTHSGWPGGAFVTYRLLNGSHAGLHVFTAEHLRGLPRVGARLRAGQRLATALPGYPWIETGWAAGPVGPTPATPYDGAPDGTAMPGGKAFARFLMELGAVPLQDPGPGSDWP